MTKTCLGNKLESFFESLIVLFVLLNTFFRCSLNVNLTSKITPRCVWKLTWETLLLLKSKGGCVTFFNFQLNMISWVCLLQSGLKVIFHWKAQSFIFSRSLLLGFSGPKTFWSVVTQGMFVKQSMYNRILIDYITNCTSTNVQTKIKLKPWINWIDYFPGKRTCICYHDSYC